MVFPPWTVDILMDRSGLWKQFFPFIEGNHLPNAIFECKSHKNIYFNRTLCGTLFAAAIFSIFFRFFWPGKRGWQKQFKVCWILGSSSSCSLWKKQQLQTRPRMYLMDRWTLSPSPPLLACIWMPQLPAGNSISCCNLICFTLATAPHLFEKQK